MERLSTQSICAITKMIEYTDHVRYAENDAFPFSQSSISEIEVAIVIYRNLHLPSSA